MQIVDTIHTRSLTDAIAIWILKLESYPGWKDWNRRKVGIALYSDDFLDQNRTQSSEFFFSKEIELQHAVVLQFMGLQQTLESLKDCEFYFRRYPFKGLPITHSDHFRNVCEMYFSRFYEFRERLKKYLNAANSTALNAKINVGELIKQYDKKFDQELRTRNLIHHHQRFDDLAIDKLYMFQIVSSPKLQSELQTQYRSAAREWVVRVRTRSAQIAIFLEITAKTTLEICTFLSKS